MTTAQVEAYTEDSLKKRYLYKLFTNLISFAITLVTAGIIPRGLGPATYGDFTFLTNFFNQIITFFDTGTSTAFYTKLSQRLQEHALIRFYWGFVAILSLATLLFVTLVFSLDLESWLWPTQTARFIWLAAIFGLLTWSNRIINHIVDAYGLTVDSEIARIQQKVLGLVLILLMFWSNHFSLAEFFLYHYFILLFLNFSWWRVLKKAGIALFPKVNLAQMVVKNYSREFYDYAAPLITYAFVGLLMGTLDNWFLQKFGGSVEQGFYGLAYKIGQLCFLFTTAMTPLLTREFSKAYGQQDLAQIRTLFHRYIPMLYTIAAYFAVFLAIQAPKVSLIWGGNQFQGAALAIAIMSFYPIHATYGQLSGSIFLATGQTKLYRNIGTVTMLLSLPLTFWLTASNNWFGLNLGAVGLAIKMVVFNFITVNIQLWFNARLLNFSFWKFLEHQFYSVALLTSLVWLVKTGVDQFILDRPVLAFLTSGFIYTISVIVVLFLFPSLLFMSRADLMRQWTQLRLRIKQYIALASRNK